MQPPIDPTTLVTEIGSNWVTPTKLRPLFQDDPVVVWLEIHGAAFGFYPNQPEYGLTKILEPKGREFEAAWMARIAPEAQRVCVHAGEGRLAERVQETIRLMAQCVPVIAQPALWWPQEELYGVPDLIALASWVQEWLLTCLSTTISPSGANATIASPAPARVSDPGSIPTSRRTTGAATSAGQRPRPR